MLKLIDYKDNLPVHIECLNIEEYPWHYHQDIQILYVLEGAVELKLAYTSYRVEKNDIHFIHSEDVHGMKSLTDENLVLLLSIHLDYFSQFFPNLKSQIFTTRIKENSHTYRRQQLKLQYFIFSILNEFSRKDAGYEEKVCLISKELLDVLYRDFRGFSVNRADKIFELRFTHDLYQMDRISRVVSFVYDNYSYKLSLSEIAHDEHINKYYLSHVFQRFVGENFRDFVSMVRVEMSEIKVLSSTLSISQIAQESGFSNTKYYVEHFENWFGLHPKEYRERMKSLTIDEKEPSFIQRSITDMKGYMDTFFAQLPFYMPSFEETAATSVTLSFFDKPLRQFSFLEGLTLQIANPDLYDGDFLEKSFAYLNGLFEGKKTHTKIVLTENGNCSTQELDSPEPFSLYYKTFAQDPCIKILTEIMGGSTLKRLKQIDLIDSSSNTGGLLTINGLKKPAYYLCEFLTRLSTHIVQIGPTYLITRRQRSFQILVFNQSEEHTLDVDFHLTQLLNNFKLTEQRLNPTNTCIDYWCQLNFQHPISERDFAFIESMTMPKIKFEIIPKSQEYMYQLSLGSKEIALILIEETE